MAPPKVQRKAADDSRSDGGGEMLRIVLVGRTGLDGRLRLDPSVELYRASTALGAVGELTEAVRDNGHGAAVVVVAPGSEPPADSKRREFLKALRRVSKDVRILRLDSAGEAPEGYDGVLSADVDVAGIRAALNGRHAEALPAGDAAVLRATKVPAPSSKPAPPPPMETQEPAAMQAPASTQEPADSRDQVELAAGLIEPPAAAAPPGTSDEVLVRLLLQGRDVTDAAIDLARQRLGGRDLTYVTAGTTKGAPHDGVHEASVAWRGRMLGRLRSREVMPEELAIHAAWLASWLVLRDQHVQLREAAFSDPLTGAHNRRYFDQFLKLAMEEARRERRGVTLLMFDIDDFKQFNDRYGHAAGDEILRETVRLLRSVIRPSDKVCRIGGDEFAVVFHEPTGPRSPSSRPPSDVCQIAERFQREIEGHRFPKLGREAPGTLSISGGLATYPWDGATPEALLARADELAMQSKRAGKNCILFGPAAEGAAPSDEI